jgi:hypothetical protein
MEKIVPKIFDSFPRPFTYHDQNGHHEKNSSLKKEVINGSQNVLTFIRKGHLEKSGSVYLKLVTKNYHLP